MEAITTQQHVQEVGSRRIILIPLRDADLHLVVGVLDVGELDVRRHWIDRCFVTEIVQDALNVGPDVFRYVGGFGNDRDRLALGSGFLDKLFSLVQVRRRPGLAWIGGVYAALDMPREARRQDLTDGRCKVRAAEYA